jgi:WD40 repeat protein
MKVPHRFRFSLRTPIALNILIASSVTLWWHWQSWVLVHEFEVSRPNPYVPTIEAGAALSNDKTKLCWRAMDRVWRMYDLRSGTLCWEWKCPDDGYTNIGNGDPGLRFTPDDRFVVIRKFPFDSRLLRASDGELMYEAPDSKPSKYPVELKPFSNVYRCFSADRNRTLVRSSKDGAEGWSLDDAATATQIAFIPGARNCRGSCFSPDGNRIATTSYDGGAAIHDAVSGRTLVAMPACKMCRTVEFSRDGKMLLVVGRGWNVHVFRRQHCEGWWGIATLPEFWTTLVFALSIVFSLRSDWRETKKSDGSPSL